MNQLYDLKYEHPSCHCKQPCLIPDSPNPCYADFLMVKDFAPQPQVVPPLLSRMANLPLAILSVSTLSIVALSTPLIGHMPPVVAPFTPLPSNTSFAPLTPLKFPMVPCFAMSQFYNSIGLYSLHPILSYMSNQYFCTALARDGDIDFISHALFVYAFGNVNVAGPAWTTYLVTREQLTDKLHAPMLATNLPLPLTQGLSWVRFSQHCTLQNKPKYIQFGPELKEVLNKQYLTHFWADLNDLGLVRKHTVSRNHTHDEPWPHLYYWGGGGGIVSLYYLIKIQSLRRRLTPSSV